MCRRFGPQLYPDRDDQLPVLGRWLDDQAETEDEGPDEQAGDRRARRARARRRRHVHISFSLYVWKPWVRLFIRIAILLGCSDFGVCVCVFGLLQSFIRCGYAPKTSLQLDAPL